MSFTYLDERSVYEERYDQTTVAICRDREALVQEALGKRPPLSVRGEAETGNGYYKYSIMYFHFVEAIAGERWQQREETITKWMAEDEAKDRRLADAKSAVIPYCRSCGEDMQITHKSYLHRERGPTNAGEEDILFMLDCTSCNKRMASWQDGTEWKPPQARCEHCGAPVEETDKRRGNVLTSTYSCEGCGHSHKSTLRLGASAKSEPEPDPDFTLDRRRFCFDAATGEKFLSRKAHLEHIRTLLAKAGQSAGASGAAPNPVAQAAKDIKRLKVAQVANLLAKAAAKAGYIDFKLGEIQVGPQLAVPFSCLDNEPERDDYDSRTRLKRLITTALADTNWRLMSEGIRHRLGHLSGRLRAYEAEEEIRTLAEKQLKGGRKKPVARPAPLPEPTPQPEPIPAAKRTGRRKDRPIQVVGIFHPDLHMVIPPREERNLTPKTQGTPEKESEGRAL